MNPTVHSTAHDILFTKLKITSGTVVPVTEDIVMKDGGRSIDATYIYADLAGSTFLAHRLTNEAAAVIIRAYISTASRILKHFGGEIRSFDGDRVMAIFIGERKEWNAVRSALAINWAVHYVLKPMIKERWTDVDGLYSINHGIGIDTGEALIVRGGVRDNNDLLSVGESPNVAAKLSGMRERGSILITARVKAELSDDLLVLDSGASIWQLVSNSVSLGGDYYSVYGCNAWWDV